MMKLAALTALVASASAFAPAQTGKATTALNAFEDELGAQAPLGFFNGSHTVQGVLDVDISNASGF